MPEKLRTLIFEIGILQLTSPEIFMKFKQFFEKPSENVKNAKFVIQ